MRACEAWGLGFFFVCLGVLVFAGFFVGGEKCVGVFQFGFFWAFCLLIKPFPLQIKIMV